MGAAVAARAARSGAVPTEPASTPRPLSAHCPLSSPRRGLSLAHATMPAAHRMAHCSLAWRRVIYFPDFGFRDCTTRKKWDFIPYMSGTNRALKGVDVSIYAARRTTARELCKRLVECTIMCRVERPTLRSSASRVLRCCLCRAVTDEVTHACAGRGQGERCPPSSR